MSSGAWKRDRNPELVSSENLVRRERVKRAVLGGGRNKIKSARLGLKRRLSS